MHNTIKGILPPPIIPYNQNGEVKSDLLVKLYTFLISNGVHGLFVGGSTGEWPLLTREERRLTAKTAVETASKQIPVVMNISSLIIDEAIEYGKYAKEIGIDAVSLLVPSYFSYDDIGMEQYFSTISKSVDLPIYIYNIPSNVKNSISAPLLKKLASQYDNIVGLKDSSMDFMTFLEYSEACGPDFPIFMGNDGQILSSLMWGGIGAVSASATVFPKEVVEIYECFIKGDMIKAKKAQQKIIKLRTIFRSYPPMSAHKMALRFRGIEVGSPRSPLRGLNKVETDNLRGQLQEIGLL